MARGQRPGGLTFHCRGRKLTAYTEVPDRTRAYIAARHPEFAHAPERWSEPNDELDVLPQARPAPEVAPQK
ncbi:hypothetical protein SCALM49S_07360 [Streptomyces californicus]